MKLLRTLLITTVLATGSVAYAAGEHLSRYPTPAGSHEAMGHGSHDTAEMKNTIKLSLMPQGTLSPRKTTKITAKLTLLMGDKVLGDADLKEAHTRKLHLLVVDPSLSDYHHIHPVPAKNGKWTFDFTPKINGRYRIWADVLPIATNKQEYVMADLGIPSGKKTKINKTTNMVSKINDYTFTLALDDEPKAGQAVMGSITISKDGKSFNQLEPVMGAFAHVVGFSEDYESILHIHPMGREPTSNTERGGPKLEFHIEPKKAGFIKLFAQVKIDGKEVFAPFGVIVK